MRTIACLKISHQKDGERLRMSDDESCGANIGVTKEIFSYLLTYSLSYYPLMVSASFCGMTSIHGSAQQIKDLNPEMLYKVRTTITLKSDRSITFNHGNDRAFMLKMLPP